VIKATTIGSIRHRPNEGWNVYAITDSAERAALAADHDFFEALKGGDTASLDRVLNDDFVIVDVMSGGITTKEALVSAIRERQLLFETIEVAERETLVRVYQSTAVLVGRTEMRGRFGQTPFVAASRYTHVYVLQDGRWRLASAQGTPITQAP